MKALLLLAIQLFIFSLFAGNDKEVVGARSFGLAGNAIQFKDIWSAENNPAGLGELKTLGAGFSYQNQFLLNELATKALVIAYPINNASFGLTFKQFGFSRYQENKLGLSYGMQLSKSLNLGIQLNYFSIQLNEGYGNKGVITGNIGLQARITEDLSLAAMVINPNNAKLADFDDERIPSILKLGLAYNFSKKVQVLTEVVKDIDFDPILRFGLEYIPLEMLYFRLGYATTPGLSSFGFGLILNRFTLDIASSFDSNLGFSPQVSLSYVPKKNP